jgi:hypothetical protein
LVSKIRNCVNSDCSPETFYELGKSLFEQNEYDFSFRAIERAAEHGYGPAMKDMGKIFDPVYFDDRFGLDQPDPEFALEWYQKAQQAGESDTNKLKLALCKKLLTLATADPASDNAETHSRLCRQ